MRAQFSDELNIMLGARSLEAFTRFQERPGQDIDLRQVGYLFLLSAPEDVAAFERDVKLQNELGVASRMIDVAEAWRLSPLIDTREVLAAAYSPDDGHCTPESVVLGYATAARRQGAVLRTGTTVLGLEHRGDRISAVATNQGTITADTVICAAGAWSAAIGEMAGVELPVQPMRRQVMFTEPISGLPPSVPFTIDFATSFYFHREGRGLLLGISDPDQAPGFHLDYSEDWLPRLGEGSAGRSNDLREAAVSAVPVVSTAFGPIEAEELARNPFGVFTSMLTPADPRFFGDDLRSRLENFLAGRELFPPELIALAGRAEREKELPEAEAERFLELAVESFKLSGEPVDKAWYQTLEKISAVAADIGGVRSTHINHLTPRVLDIDELYRKMTERGIEMIDAIQGPPRWPGPDVLLRQTSFRALAEPRHMRRADGTVTTEALRVQFGEVEARGIALTCKGRARYDLLLEETERRAAPSGTRRDEAAQTVWQEGFPCTERGLIDEGLAFFTYHLREDRPRHGRPPASVAGLLDQGWVRAEPIVYEDFLPRSAAGIFQSNLSGEGTRDNTREGARYGLGWLAGAIDRDIHDPFALYARQQNTSIAEVAKALGFTGALGSPLSAERNPDVRHHPVQH